MKKIYTLIICALAVCGLINAQTLTVQQGQVKYLFPAENTGQMPYDNGSTLTVMNKVFTLDNTTTMYVDNSAIADNTVLVVYSDTEA